MATPSKACNCSKPSGFLESVSWGPSVSPPGPHGGPAGPAARRLALPAPAPPPRAPLASAHWPRGRKVCARPPRQASRLTLRGPAHEASPRGPSLTPTPRWQGEGFLRLLLTNPGHAPGAAEPRSWRPSLLPVAGNRRHGDKAGR